MPARIDIKIPEAEKKAFIAAIPDGVSASKVIRELLSAYVQWRNENPENMRSETIKYAAKIGQQTAHSVVAKMKNR